MGKLKTFVSDLKKLFGHDNKMPIKQQGIKTLGGSFQSTAKFIPDMELMVIGDFTKCVELIANSIATIKFNVYKFSKNKWTNDEFNHLNYLLNRKPTEDMTAHQFKRNIIWNMCMYGRAIIYIERDSFGKIKSLIPIFSNYVERTVINGKPFYKLNGSSSTSSSVDNPNLKDDFLEQDIPAEDIIYIPWSGFDNFQNMQFRTLYVNCLSKIRANDVSTLNAFKNDLGVYLVVKTKEAVDTDQKTQIQNNITQSFHNMKEDGVSAILIDEKLEIESNLNITQTPIALETRKYVASELAAKFGIPNSFLGIESPNISLSQSSKQYLDLAVKPFLDKIIDAMNDSFFSTDMKKELRYSLVELSGLDLKDKSQFISQVINTGVLTPNECRELIGYDSVVDGDKLYANQALLPLEKLGERLSAESQKFDSESHKLDVESDNLENNGEIPPIKSELNENGVN